MRAVGGRGTNDIDWPQELRFFKTADTSHYVVATATLARSCATCARQFARDDRRSLTVEVRVPSPPPSVTPFLYRRFAAQVHHTACHPAQLTVVPTAADEPSAGPFLGESDMHFVLTTHPTPGGGAMPALVFTSADPIVIREMEQAEGRSAWISTYLQLGFQLFSTSEVRWIMGNAPTATAVEGSLDGALFTLAGTVDGRQVSLLQWTRRADQPAYRRWREAVRASQALFVLYGEYVVVDTVEGTVDLAPGGRLGDIAAAIVRVGVV